MFPKRKLCLLSGVMVLALVIAPGMIPSSFAAVAQGEIATAPPAVSPSADLSTVIAKIAKDTIPAVAHIEVTQSHEVSNPLTPFESDPFFHYFFNTPRNMPKKFKQELKGIGTGMIIDPEGHILTNNHVVQGATSIDVLLADGNHYKGIVVGTDPKTDLAVIQIKAGKPLPYVTFGDSDKMKVGYWVVAIGHPRNLDQTVTQGIISAKHRRGILDPNTYQDYLQTDAAINPGNSGGPLLNLQGQVIGVNAAIMTDSGGFEGIGFAIPSNMAVHIAKILIAHGKVVRGWLGVSVQDLTPDLVKAMKLKITKGALIADVVRGGPADVAGVKKGDVVISYQGKAITNDSELQNDVANTPIGQEAAMTVMRDGKTFDVRVKVGNLHDAVRVIGASLENLLGAAVRPVTPAEVRKFGLDHPQGVAIESLQKDGSLAKAGFEVNDIILGINNQAVKDVKGFVGILETLRPRQVIQILALDHKSGQTGYVRVRVR